MSDTRASARVKGLVVEWASVSDTTLYAVKFGNQGAKTIDVRKLAIGSPSAKRPTGGRLKVVRGSAKLAPGESALVVVHPEIDVNDEARAMYENVYVALDSDGNRAIYPRDGLALVDSEGAAAIVIDPTIMTIIGKCCSDSSGTCGPSPGGCTGGPLCFSKVSHNDCCYGGLGCCFKANDTSSCGSGCPSGAFVCP